MQIGNPILKIDTGEGVNAAETLKAQALQLRPGSVLEVGESFGLAPGKALLFLDENGAGKQLLLLLYHPQVCTHRSPASACKRG
jgi:hypothetical protein